MQCPTGKVEYPTRAAAKRSARVCKTKGLRRGRPHLRPYMCSHCSRWHLTSMTTKMPTDIYHDRVEAHTEKTVKNSSIHGKFGSRRAAT